jgi:hypothetical protein
MIISFTTAGLGRKSKSTGRRRSEKKTKTSNYKLGKTNTV